MIRAWRVYWNDPAGGARCSWRLNSRDATSRLRRAKKEVEESHGKKASIEPAGIAAVDVPTQRSELVDFLNQHAMYPSED